MRHSGYFEFDVFYGLLIIGVLVLILGLACRDCKKRRACEESGGRVVETNCRTTIRCETIQHDDWSSTECRPSTICDWTCIHEPATAERP
jgi:hypothetical protein